MQMHKKSRPFPGGWAGAVAGVLQRVSALAGLRPGSGSGSARSDRALVEGLDLGQFGRWKPIAGDKIRPVGWCVLLVRREGIDPLMRTSRATPTATAQLRLRSKDHSTVRTRACQTDGMLLEPACGTPGTMGRKWRPGSYRRFRGRRRNHEGAVRRHAGRIGPRNGRARRG